MQLARLLSRHAPKSIALPCLLIMSTCVLSGFSVSSSAAAPMHSRMDLNDVYFAVEFSDEEVQNGLLGAACRSWINEIAHVAVYTDRITRSSLPESILYEECGHHVELVSIASLVTFSVEKSNTHLGESIGLAQVKREVIVADVNKRVWHEGWNYKWFVFTEQDTWWSISRLLLYLGEVEAIFFDENTSYGKRGEGKTTDLSLILAGLGGTRMKGAYGPFIIMSRGLLDRLTRRYLQEIRAAAMRCLVLPADLSAALPSSPGNSNALPQEGKSKSHIHPLQSKHLIPNLVVTEAKRMPTRLFSCMAQPSVLDKLFCESICEDRDYVKPGAIFNNDHLLMASILSIGNVVDMTHRASNDEAMLASLTVGSPDPDPQSNQTERFLFYYNNHQQNSSEYVQPQRLLHRQDIHDLVAFHHCKSQCQETLSRPELHDWSVKKRSEIGGVEELAWCRQHGATGKLHWIPSVFLIGAQKSGTTSLFNHLWRELRGTAPKFLHLESGKSLPGEPLWRSKEAHFFDHPKILQDGLTAELVDEYVSRYPECSSNQSALFLDATPNYLMQPESPERIVSFYNSVLSKLKFIVILRDPSERTESYFYHARRDGFLELPLPLDPIGSNIANISYKEWVYLSMRQVHDCRRSKRLTSKKSVWPQCGHGGLTGGMYAAQLRHWLKAGFSPSQIAVISFSQFQANKSLVMSQLAEFLEMRYTAKRKQTFHSNQDFQKSRHPELGQTVRARVDKFFESSRKALKRLLRARNFRVIPNLEKWSQGEIGPPPPASQVD